VSAYVEPGTWTGTYSYTAPTPVTHRKVVYAWFGAAVLAAAGFDGKLLWR
jgi:hypothetical protein